MKIKLKKPPRAKAPKKPYIPVKETRLMPRKPKSLRKMPKIPK